MTLTAETMNEESTGGLISERDPEERENQSPENDDAGANSALKVSSPPADSLDIMESLTLPPVDLGSGSANDGAKAPSGGPPVEDAPGRDPLAEEAPGRDPLAEVAPGRDPPVEEAPGRDSPVEEAPGRDPLAEEAPGRDPLAEDAPGRDPLAEDAPGRDPLAEDAPGRDPSAEDAPGEDAPGGDPSAGNAPPAEDAPVDWFEPVEEDDDTESWDLPISGKFNGRRDAEEDSLAGESEKSGSVASSERTAKRVYQYSYTRRKRSNPDEGWEAWPSLGEGWKRKEVVRRSGSSIGQKDIYYLSPRGERVRSRVELASVIDGALDISLFEYKTGKFHNGALPFQSRRKRKVRERSSSESSWMERGEGADTPEVPKPSPSSAQSPLSYSAGGPDRQTLKDVTVKLPQSTAAKWLPSINGQMGSEDTILVCAQCGNSFTGTWYDRQRKRPSCPRCWASKTREHPQIRFRKWIPCGQCVACRNLDDCGQCANCKHGLQSPESRKRLCRKRKCICPIRKSPRSQTVFHLTPKTEPLEPSVSFQTEVLESQNSSYQNSDTEDFMMNNNNDDDEDDYSTDDDDDWHKKRKRRSCGKCKACLCRKDCGTCDFCVDKPKFGGSNKKRQKCRLRQCQRQAMRHLLPFQMGQAESLPEGQMVLGRPRPQYTYSRKPASKRSRAAAFGLEFSENEDDNSSLRPMSWSSELPNSRKPYDLSYINHQSSIQVGHSEAFQKNGLSERVPHISMHSSPQLLAVPHATGLFPSERLARLEGQRCSTARDADRRPGEPRDSLLPVVTRIVSLAETPAASGVETDKQLLKLLERLRGSTLPLLWSVIMVDGPRLQLIQCSKQSKMIDTMVLIDPGFCYHVTVQNQPLLVTHPLYDKHPTCLSSVSEVVLLLMDLENYSVCQGLELPEFLSHKGPVIFERASTCDFLIPAAVRSCANCRALCP